jgi:hypothetical protein
MLADMHADEAGPHEDIHIRRRLLLAKVPEAVLIE